MYEPLEKTTKEISEKNERKQDIRLKCVEIAAHMMGPQNMQAGETVQQYLNRFLPLSNVIEIHVTGSLPNQV